MLSTITVPNEFNMCPYKTYECPSCVKTVFDTEEGIGCDGPCLRWFHRDCIKVTKSEYIVWG